MSDSSRWTTNDSLHTQVPSSTPYMPQSQHSPNYPGVIAAQQPVAYDQQRLNAAADIPSSSLRTLQPSPYPAGYPAYQYLPNNGNDNATTAANIKKESSFEDKDDMNDSRRTRISRACDACRRKKIKCDTFGPGSICKHCKSSKIDCTFNDSAKKRGPPKGYIEVLENRLKRMEAILGNIAPEDEKSNIQTSDSEQQSDVQQQPTIQQKQKSSGNKKKKQVATSKVEKMNPASTCVTSTDPQPATPLGAQADTKKPPLAIELSSITSGMKTRYIGDMSPFPFLAQKIDFEDARFTSQTGMKIKRFGQSLVLYMKDDGQDANQQLLLELGMLKPGETIKSMNDWIYKVAGVDKSTSDSLMKIYFAYIHPSLPVVNKYLFLKQYRGEISEYPSAPLLNAMYGAAVRYIETCRVFGDDLPLDHDIEFKENWSERLFENLIVYVKRKYNPCISTVQALVIGQNHRSSLDEKITSGWLLNSAAIRMAQDLGLHRSSESWDIPVSEKETRKRVWWAVYIMDKWSAAGTGRPQTIFDEDCDESYPSESADWDEVMDVATNKDEKEGILYPSLDKNVAQKAKNENIPLYQPFVQLVKLSEILGRLLQGLYTPLAKKQSEKHGSDAAVTYLDEALSKWRSALPPALQISSINVRRLDSRGRTPLLSMSGLMYLSYCTLLILLHRPFIEKEGEQRTRSSQSSLSICTSAATRCVDIAEKMHYRDFLLVSWNFAIYPIFTASLIHMYNATNPDSIVYDVAKSNLIKAIKLFKRLSKLSNGASKLYKVLLQLIEMQKINIDPSELSEEDHDDDNNNSSDNNIKSTPATKKQRTTSAPKKRPQTITTSGAIREEVSDVGRGSYRAYMNNRDSSTKEMSSPSANMSDSEVDRASTHSTPTSTGNGDWINGLYSCMQDNSNSSNGSVNQPMVTDSNKNSLQSSMLMQDQQSSVLQQSSQQPYHPYQNTQSNVLGGEPYCLKQFGLIMDQVCNTATTLDTNCISAMPPTTPYTPNTSAPALSQLQQPIMFPINPADSFLFGLTSNNETSHYSTSNNNNPIAHQSAAATSAYNNTTTAANTSNFSVMDQSMFRNRPDNPFWSVPSSIELDDWTAYLLPQQPTMASNTASSNTVNTTATSSNNNNNNNNSWNPVTSSWV